MHTILLNQPDHMQKAIITPRRLETNLHCLGADLSVSPARHFSADAKVKKQCAHKLRTALHHGLALKTLNLCLDFILNLTPPSNFSPSENKMV